MAVTEKVTQKAFDCMDERELLALLRKNFQSNQFEIIIRGDDAKKVVTAKLPGGGLGFVKAVQQFGNKSLIEAFQLVESVCKSLRFEPMVHIDNHHGQAEIEEMNDEELVEFVANYFEGCGFAKLSWGEGAGDVVRMAMERGWLIGILGGQHGAKEAVRITQTDVAVDRTMSKADAFSFNIPETKIVLQKLGNALSDTVFANVAFGWLDKTFGEVAIKLGNDIREITSI